VLLLSRQVSAQGGARKRLKYAQNRLERSFLNIFLTFYVFVVCSPRDKRKRPSIQFSENDEIIFHLAAMSQCEQGGEGLIWNSAHAD
jgi:hypothetical protein